jgi:beta-lactamase regulating signal transducer with metallopeptidase domain
MLDTVFYFILNMSVASCFVITALLLIRQIRPLSRRVVYPLWILAFLRLVMPFSFSSGWSLFNYTGGLIKKLITVETVRQRMVPLPTPSNLLTMNFIGAAEQYAPIEYKTESLRQVFSVASVIWAIAAAAMLLTAIILYLLTRKELKKAVHIKGGLYRSEMLLSPVLMGLIRPKIILPQTLDPDSAECRMVLAHENIHKRRLDNLWRLLGIGITCLHWFNPFAWIMLKAFFADMELSCDEAVIKKYNLEERKVYAGALLRFAEDKRMLVSTAFGRAGVKVRIVNVLNYKKLTLVGAVASSLFLIAVAVILITNPQLGG